MPQRQFKIQETVIDGKRMVAIFNRQSPSQNWGLDCAVPVWEINSSNGKTGVDEKIVSYDLIPIAVLKKIRAYTRLGYKLVNETED